ncbi:MAG: ATP-binding cassette domain-containing protein [Leifsonia sp.]
MSSVQQFPDPQDPTEGETPVVPVAEPAELKPARPVRARGPVRSAKRPVGEAPTDLTPTSRTSTDAVDPVAARESAAAKATRTRAKTAAAGAAKTPAAKDASAARPRATPAKKTTKASAASGVDETKAKVRSAAAGRSGARELKASETVESTAIPAPRPKAQRPTKTRQTTSTSRTTSATAATAAASAPETPARTRQPRTVRAPKVGTAAGVAAAAAATAPTESTETTESIVEPIESTQVAGSESVEAGTAESIADLPETLVAIAPEPEAAETGDQPTTAEVEPGASDRGPAIDAADLAEFEEIVEREQEAEFEKISEFEQLIAPVKPVISRKKVAARPLPIAAVAPPATAKVVLSIAGLHKSFGRTHAVAGIDLEVRAGSFYGIVGPNGAGKTTTLSMVTGLLRPDEGAVTVHNVDVWDRPDEAKRIIGVLPDRLRLFDRLTGAQLLYYAGTLHGLDAQTVRQRSTDLVNAFGLDEAIDRLVADYSAGMTKKIALACAMIHSPRLLVLDEPFEAVDPVSAANLIEILQNYVAAGGTVVLSSHGMDMIERVCDSVAIIVRGQVLASGTLDEVRQGERLEDRFVELAGGRKAAEGMEWLHSFSD